MTELRPYQVNVIGDFHAARAANHRRILMVAPTGSGKTVIAASLASSKTRGGGQVLFLAHRREIVGHTVEKLFDLGIDAGIIQAGVEPRQGQAVQVLPDLEYMLETGLGAADVATRSTQRDPRSASPPKPIEPQTHRKSRCSGLPRSVRTTPRGIQVWSSIQIARSAARQSAVLRRAQKPERQTLR